jgi:hypothetical protein
MAKRPKNTPQPGGDGKANRAVLVLKMISGETVIARILQETTKTYMLHRPMVLIRIVSMDAEGHQGVETTLHNWIEHSDSQAFKVNKSQVLGEGIPNAGLLEEYALTKADFDEDMAEEDLQNIAEKKLEITHDLHPKDDSIPTKSQSDLNEYVKDTDKYRAELEKRLSAQEDSDEDVEDDDDFSGGGFNKSRFSF